MEERWRGRGKRGEGATPRSAKGGRRVVGARRTGSELSQGEEGEGRKGDSHAVNGSMGDHRWHAKEGGNIHISSEGPVCRR